jgi:antitoxin MazE
MTMNRALRARIVKIGNSHGVRIPKVWLDQLELGDEVEMTVQEDQITIRGAHQPRHDWDRQFQTMAAEGDDRLPDEATPTQWDQDEWEW